MSHEASIGKIAPEEVEYLMSRGMRSGRRSPCLSGDFWAPTSAGLGAELDARIAEIVEIAGQGKSKRRFW
jgi:Fe-S cluster assembly scaffold protein SufB